MPGHYWLELRIKGDINRTENQSVENADKSDQPSKITSFSRQLLALNILFEFYPLSNKLTYIT